MSIPVLSPEAVSAELERDALIGPPASEIATQKFRRGLQHPHPSPASPAPDPGWY